MQVERRTDSMCTYVQQCPSYNPQSAQLKLTNVIHSCDMHETIRIGIAAKYNATVTEQSVQKHEYDG